MPENPHSFSAQIKPPRLESGDTIGIVSPAGPLNEERLQTLERGVRYIQDRGYNVVLGKHVREQVGYLAGSDEMRADDVNEMLRRPDVKALFFTRGGYGVTRILSHIDYAAVSTAAKIIVGYSDATALHLAMFNKSGLITFSGPMVAIELGKKVHPLTERSLWSMLSGEKQNIELDEQTQNTIDIFSGGTAEGPLLGGCLTVLVSLLGTPYMPDMRGAILLLEDIGEDVYKIDRYLSQLKNTGVLDVVSGVILGQFLDIASDENENPATLLDVFDYYFTPLNVPVLANYPYGHSPVKVTLPIGCRVRLDADDKKVQLLESCLAV